MAGKFWVGGGTNTNWNSSPTTNWANISGGAGNQTAPATGDDVTLDGNGASANGTSVLNAAISLNSLTVTSGFTGTLSHSAAVALTITGTPFTLGASMTYTPVNVSTSSVTFAATTGTVAITPNGKALGQTTFNGAGGTFQIQGDITLGISASSVATFTAGTFDANGHNVTTAGNVVINGATLLLGSGIWNVSGTWNYTSGTITPSTSALNFVGTQTTNRTFAFGAQPYNAVSVSNGGATGAGMGSENIFTGAATFASFGLTAPITARFTAGTNLTITGALTAAGNLSSSPIHLHSDSLTGAQATLTCGSTAVTGAVIENMAFSGSGLTATSSVSIGNNSGIAISPPSGGVHMIGG